MTEKICPGSDPGPKEKSEATSQSSKTKVTKSPAARHDLTVEAVILLLQERWPHCFSIHERNRRPLKVGIFADILKDLEHFRDTSMSNQPGDCSRNPILNATEDMSLEKRSVCLVLAQCYRLIDHLNESCPCVRRVLVNPRFEQDHW